MIGRGPEGDSEEVAIEERVLVVATGRPDAVHARGGRDGRVKGSAREVADRRDIEPVELACWIGRQVNVQPDDFDLEFGKPEPAPARRSNYRRCCHAAGHQSPACGKQSGAGSNFPGRPGNVGILQIIGEDFRYSPPSASHVEIVIHTGELARAQGGIPLVRQAVDAIKVAVIPKWAARHR